MIRRWSLLRQWFEKMGWQILSVLLAILAWVYVNSQSSIEQSRMVKLQYVGLPEGLTFKRAPIREVRMAFSGPVHLIRGLKDDELVYLVDLSSARAGTRKVSIDPDELKINVDIKAERPTPRSVSVELEEVFTKTLTLKPILLGIPKQGFEVRRVVIRPDRIQVSGPRSTLAKLDLLEVPVQVSGRDQSFSMAVTPSLELPDAQINERLTAEVEILPREEMREFEGVPVIAEGATRKFKITPSSALVVIEGPELGLGNAVNNLRVRVNVRNLSPGRYRIRGKVDLPANVKLRKLEPENFLVEVLRED